MLASFAMARRALIVDDSEAMRRAIRFALKGIAGLDCVEATDGLDALKKVGRGRFDVVLTDLNMPMMDGLKLINHLRKSPATRALPIVIITTEGKAEDRDRAMALGANAFLVKPVKDAQIVDAVKGLLAS